MSEVLPIPTDEEILAAARGLRELQARESQLDAEAEAASKASEELDRAHDAAAADLREAEEAFLEMVCRGAR